MARSKRSPARLVIALAVAGLLAVFLLYTAVVGNSTPNYKPSQLAGKTGDLSISGRVVGPVTGDAHSAGGLRFTLRDPGSGAAASAATVAVVYHGTVPDMFKAGRDVNASGTLEHGSFVADGLTTKCPSKYKS